MNKTFKELGFKAGDKVKCVESKYSVYAVGKVYTLEDWYSSDRTYHTVVITGSWNGNSATWEKVEDMFEDQWHLNDGKVEIPDDADKLEKDGSVVAFRYRISPKYKFGDILIGKCTETEYRFIKYDNTGISKDRYATLLNSLNSIVQGQNLDNYKLKTND